MKFMSLKWKLVAVLLLITVVPVIALGSITYSMTSNILQSEVNKTIEQTITQINEDYNSFFEKIGTSLQFAASSQHVKETSKNVEDGAEMMKEFVEYIDKYPDVLQVYLGTEDGRMHIYPSTELPPDFNPTQRPWYQSAKEKQGNTHWTEPYVDVGSGEYVITASVEIKDAVGNITGVMGVDINLQELTKLMSSIKIGESGCTFAADSKGITITHSDKERIGKGIGEYDWGKQIINNSSGSLEYSVDNVEKLVVYQRNEATGWKIAGIIEKKELTSKLSQIKNTIYIIGIIGLLLALFGSFFAGGIVSPIKMLSQIIEQFSKYDLTVDENSEAFKYLNRKDEIGLITNSLVTMKNNLVSLINGIADTSQQLASSSEELTATSQQSATTSEEVSRTIEEIANGSSDQARNTEEGVVHISELGQLIEKDQEYLEELNSAANEVSMLKDEGLEGLKDLVEKTNISNRASHNIEEVIINTNASAKKIENASQMIKSIAEQTNLLALNAAIEAARAGETGRGFAVVAEEIRRLSEQSNAFTGEITKIIQELISKTTHATEIIEEVDKTVASQTKSVEESNDRFEGIAAAIEEMKRVIANINQSGQEMANKKGHIISIMENLSAISEENAAGTQEASASIEEQTSSMKEIANASESLAKLAEEMQESISRFKY